MVTFEHCWQILNLDESNLHWKTYEVGSISFAKKKVGVLVFLKFTISIMDYFKISWCQSDLCCTVRSVLPKYISSIRTSQQVNFPIGLKLDPLESVLNPLRAIKRKERLNIEYIEIHLRIFLVFNNIWDS